MPFNFNFNFTEMTSYCHCANTMNTYNSNVHVSWWVTCQGSCPLFIFRSHTFTTEEKFFAVVEVANFISIKAMFLDMSVDAPARANWQAIKQYNGYWGC